MTPTRPATLEDARALAELLRVNREFLAPWDPIREDDYYTVEGQLAVLRDALDRQEQGTAVTHVIVAEDGRVVGRITLSGIVRGPFQSCGVGYWVAGPDNGRGLATAALGHLKDLAFGELGLHRIEAGALPHNVRSQRVLERNGFVRFGVAPQYLSIAGQWQDHVMYQVLST
jgi:ribosomal-protein-alanine N-acetyltransferase